MAERVIVNDLYEGLFPNGDIPSLKEIQERITGKNFTVRDAIVLKAYNDGMIFGEMADITANKNVVEMLQDKFPRSKSGGGNASAIHGYLQSFRNVLDKHYFDVLDFDPEENTKKLGLGISSTGGKQKALDRIVSMYYKRATGGKKTFPRELIQFDNNQSKPAKSLEYVNPELKKIWQAIGDASRSIITDTETYGKNGKKADMFARAFLFANLAPVRIKDMMRLTLDPKVARKEGGLFLYQLDNGQYRAQLLTDPVAGRSRVKKDVASFTLTKLQEKLLLPLIEQAKKDKENRFKRIFPKLTNANFTGVVNKHFKPKLQQYEGQFDIDFKGAKEMRKLGASAVADVMDTDMSAIVLGHFNLTPEIKKRIAAVAQQYYVRPVGVQSFDRAKDPLALIYSIMENEIARTLGYEDIQDLAVSLSGIKIPNYADETINVVEPNNQGEAGKTTKTSPEVKALKEKSLRANLETNIAITKQKGAEAGAKTEEAIQKRLITRQENIKLREQGTPVKAPKLNLNSKAMVSLLEETNTSLDELKNMSDEEILDYLDNKMSGKADVKPEGQEFRADDIDTPRVRSYGATLEATAPDFLDFVTDPETLKKAGKVGLELAGGVPKKIFKAGKIAIEAGKKIKPDIKDPAERFDILEPVPEEEEKETTEERTRGQINNLFDSPLGP
tara:strand:+ start:46 stop:2064 length:2019 start_codon:yes stop_codon:yes gene_type:complete